MFRTNNLFLRRVDGDPPVLQPLPNVVQTYKYLQVADMTEHISKIFRICNTERVAQISACQLSLEHSV